MEVNATEKIYLPVDGILEMFHSLTGRHDSDITHSLLQGAALAPGPQHLKVSNISKTSMGIIKTVKGRLKQQEKGSVSPSKSSCSGNRQVSTDRPPKRSVDLLELGLTKRRNCHRIVVLGAPKVGKTNILLRFLGKDFEEQYEPTTEDFHRKLFHVGGEAYQMDLLDAAGERDFPAKRRLSILTGDTFLLVFSLDDRESFDEVCVRLNEIKDAKAKLLNSKHPARPRVVVCGNKADIAAPRAVRRSEVTEALGEDVAFFETSAKDGAGTEAAFRALAALSGLPDETSPSRHQLVSILSYQAMRVGPRGWRGGSRGFGAPCAAVDPLARRPSFTSDLRLVLKSSTKHNKHERCQIQ